MDRLCRGGLEMAILVLVLLIDQIRPMSMSFSLYEDV
jgi:hypothetical protein